MTLQSSSVTFLRNDRRSRQQTLGCHRPVIPAVSYYYLVTKPCFGKKMCCIGFCGYSLNFIIRQWELIDLLFYVYSGVVARFDDKVGVLESPWISKNITYEKTGLCLSFSYLFSAHSGSSVTFKLLTSSKNVSLWSLHGYQGQKWLTGQVSFKPSDDFKV